MAGSGIGRSHSEVLPQPLDREFLLESHRSGRDLLCHAHSHPRRAAVDLQRLRPVGPLTSDHSQGLENQNLIPKLCDHV